MSNLTKVYASMPPLYKPFKHMWLIENAVKNVFKCIGQWSECRCIGIRDDWWLWVVLVVFICGRKYRIIITAPQSTQFHDCKKLKLKVNNSVVGTTNNSPQCTVLSDILCKQQYQTLHHAFIGNKVMNCCNCLNAHLHKFFYRKRIMNDYCLIYHVNRTFLPLIL